MHLSGIVIADENTIFLAIVFLFRWVTNNGTLEHEVWMGDLTRLAGVPRRVVALFNKGVSAEPLHAPASLYTRDLVQANAAVKVRDVVNKQDLVVKPGAPIAANVPSHGVAFFVVSYPSSLRTGIQ